jgi:hypothetical protein
MDPTEQFQTILAKLSICINRVMADILANFQVLEELLYQDEV